MTGAFRLRVGVDTRRHYSLATFPIVLRTSSFKSQALNFVAFTLADDSDNGKRGISKVEASIGLLWDCLSEVSLGVDAGPAESVIKEKTARS